MCSNGTEISDYKKKEQTEYHHEIVGNVVGMMHEQNVHIPVEAQNEQQVPKNTSFLSKVNKFVGKKEPADTAEIKQAKKIKHYQATKKEEFSQKESSRKNVIEDGALREMCEAQQALAYATPDFKNVIESVLKYLNTQDSEMRNKERSLAITKIQKYLSEHEGSDSDQEYALYMHVQAYGMYLDMNTNGSLDMKGHQHRKGEHEKNPKARALTVWVDVKDQCLFPHEPSIHDIQQRTVEDCYMMASLSAIAHFSPEYIKQSMRDNGDGTVTVRFFDEKKSDTYYKDKTIGDLTGNYVNADEAEKKSIDRKILVKLFSEFSNDSTLADSFRTSWKEKALTAEAKAGADTGDEKVEQDIEDDGFELIDDFETKTKTSEENADSPEIKGYVSKLKNLQGSFTSSNEAWLSEIVDKMLESDTAVGEQLRGVLAKIHSDGQDNAEQISKEAFEGFIDKLCTDSSAGEDVMRIWRSANSQTREKRTINEASYVTVTKEVARFGGVVDAYATDSLWVQMIEKAAAVHYGREKGYEGISLGKSYDFLNHFLNQDYDPGRDKYIINAPMESFTINGVEITQEIITSKMRNIQRRKKSVAVSIEDMLKEFEYDSKYRGMFAERTYVEQLTSELVQQFGMVHSSFSHRYTERAEDIFRDYQERLSHKECIMVGCTWDKEQTEWLTDSGIRNAHAYAVVDCFEKDGHKFVTLRDPYALFKREYTKTTDEEGNESYRIENASSIGLSKNDSNGLFNMELNDYLMTFNEYTALKQH